MKTILTLLLCGILSSSLFSQSNINQTLSVNSSGAAADASAQLDVSATDKGMLVPRMTTAQRTAIASPATGLLVFDTTTGDFWFYTGAAWKNLSTQKVLADADADTKIQVEESPDEDIIRFDLGGTESMVLRKNAGGSPRLELPNALNNNFLGTNAGSANTTGSGNAAVGYGALYSNTSGFSNTGVGAFALGLNDTRSNLVAVGDSALYNNGTGASNSFEAIQNTAIGSKALFHNTTGYLNTAIGYAALYSNTSGNRNTASGNGALYYNTFGSYNSAFGESALVSNTTGNFNTANGLEALYSNTAGGYNTANGMEALYSNTTGSLNTANGVYSLYSNTSGSLNTANGVYSLYSNTSGDNNTANGVSALYFNTSGYSNTAVGRRALYHNTDRHNLVAVGDSALFNNGTGVSNSFEAIQNTAIGSKALFHNTTGYLNTAIGYAALYSNTSGYYNTASGNGALYSNAEGVFNSAFGESALVSNTTGSYNTANGRAALYSNTTGSFNTANGMEALYSNTTGSDNTGLGDYTNVSANNLNNATAIGASATVNASNKVRLGNASVTVIEGQVAYTFPSDARFKFNVNDDDVLGLAFIEKLRPVTYQFDTRKFDQHLMQNMPDSVQQRRMEGQDYSKSTALVQTGFLAQEVEVACKELGFEFSGLHVPESEVDNYGIAYGSFVPLLVKGIQEQQATIEQQKEEIDLLKSQLEKITAALAGAGIAVEK